MRAIVLGSSRVDRTGPMNHVIDSPRLTCTLDPVGLGTLEKVSHAAVRPSYEST